MIANRIICLHIYLLLREGGSIIIPGRHDVCDKLLEQLPGSKLTYLDEIRNHGFTVNFTTHTNCPWYLANYVCHNDEAVNRDMHFEDPKLYVNPSAPLLILTYSSKPKNIIIHLDSDDESINTVTENEIDKLSKNVGGLNKLIKLTCKIRDQNLPPHKESGSSEVPASTHVIILILFICLLLYIIIKYYL